jgi:chromate reductase, NAD(P)H dehydrogenase (quinone)
MFSPVGTLTAMTVLALSGSLRAGSSNAAIVRAAADLVAIEVFATASLPHFSPDLDVDPLPEPVVELRAAVARNDAMLIATPEYAHGMPGSLKNALDWLVSATEPIDKPVLLIAASPGGAAHAHAQLLEVLRTMSMRVVDGGAHVFSRAKLDAGGNVTDPALLAALRAGLAQLG